MFKVVLKGVKTATDLLWLSQLWLTDSILEQASIILNEFYMKQVHQM